MQNRLSMASAIGSGGYRLLWWLFPRWALEKAAQMLRWTMARSRVS